MAETSSVVGDKEYEVALHGFYTHGFPNLFHLGSAQNANSVNFVHILTEQANHIAAVITKGRETGAAFIEPTAEAENAWCRTIQETSLDNRKFQAECTPGYYNRVGNPPPVSFSYGPGPVAFHRLLDRWRTQEISQVLAVGDPQKV
ncbi:MULTISPECIES: hypothetical protein [unclassified Arthrobacter]|uniref:hypothetical protein n=1 Tax=unclassified Arthrobacter TaxID=235627 RepID=UPI000CE48763|nr:MULTISPECIES: hypothetical protein [unclassified Arthrobacter]